MNFHPYHGEDYRRLQRVDGWQTAYAHDADRSGTILYRYNSLGFRSEEYDPDASLRVYVFGESHAFGTGLPLEDAWPMRIARSLAEALGVPSEKLCVMNFAESGASNAQISRMTLSQCEVAPPDLMLVNLADLDRQEAIVDGIPIRIGTWYLSSETREQVDALEPGEQRDFYERRMKRVRGYFDYADKYDWVLDTVKNILLIQYYARAKGIPTFAACDGIAHLATAAWQDDPLIGPLITQIDRTVLGPAAVITGGPKNDRAADGHHVGSIHHERFANSVWGFLATHTLDAVRRRLAP